VVSFSDHDTVAKPVERSYTFVNNETADTQHIRAINATAAWVSLSFHEDEEVDALIEQGWTLLFERDGGRAA
jgi:hypothetical protein